MESFNKAKSVVNTLKENGHEAVFAGGCVRDIILDKSPNDFDIATSATPEQVEDIFSKTKAVGKAFGVILVNFKGEEFEVATFREDGDYSDNRRPDSVRFSSMEEDSNRRDFTINSMFMDPENGKIFDFHKGLKDIKKNRIRFVGNPNERIKEDPLRMLRAIRFALRLGFKLDNKTKRAITKNSITTATISHERIRDELSKMIMAGNPRAMMDMLFDTGIMDVIIPELTPIKGSIQNPKYHPEGDVYTHTVLTMEKLSGQSLELQLAAMFHDIGKPYTMVIERGQPTNKGHDKKGAELTELIMKRLKFTNDQVELVTNLVAGHMKSHVVKDFKKSTLKRFLALPYIDDLIRLSLADAMSASGHTENIDYIRAKRLEWEPDVIKPKALITGHDLIKLGFKPGPKFGKILRTIEDLQLEGHINSREEAIRFAKGL